MPIEHTPKRTNTAETTLSKAKQVQKLAGTLQPEPHSVSELPGTPSPTSSTPPSLVKPIKSKVMDLGVFIFKISEIKNLLHKEKVLMKL